MSYILEALKKSQSDRELGQVPRLEGFGIDVPIEPPRRHPWAYVALLAGLAVLALAIFLVIRGFGATAPWDTVAAATGLPPSSPAHDGAAAGPLTHFAGADIPGQVQSPPALVAPAGIQGPAGATQPSPEPAARQATPIASQPAQVTAGTPPPTMRADAAVVPGHRSLGGASTGAQGQLAQPAAADATAAAASAAPSASSRSEVEPQVLVVPAPGKPGEPLPRGADELRRAVLGDAAGASAAVAGADARRTPPTPRPSASKPASSSDRVPIPEDVLAEIEAFKELMRQRNPQAFERAAAEPPPLPEPPGLEAALRPQPQVPPKPARPSLDLRSRLPPLSMTVHVYDDDPLRRFVYINGRKLTEGQRSREGIRLEEVLSDGAVLSYEGENFFQQR